MVGVEQNYKGKIMFEIYKEKAYTGVYRVVYFSELDDHNKDIEIDRAMKGDHFFDGFILTLKKERAMKQIEDIAKVKLPDLNTKKMESAMNMIKGTARSMGVVVEG